MNAASLGEKLPQQRGEGTVSLNAALQCPKALRGLAKCVSTAQPAKALAHALVPAGQYSSSTLA